MDIEEFLKRKKEFEKAMKENGKALVKEAIETFVKENPEITGIRWHQFAPSFNDGDPCVFSVHDLYFSTNEDISDEEWEEHPQNGEAFKATYDFEDNKKLKKACDKFETLMQGELETLLEMVFGNGMEVAVHVKNGKPTIETSEYYDE